MLLAALTMLALAQAPNNGTEVPDALVIPVVEDAAAKLAKAEAEFEAMQLEDATRVLELLVADQSATETQRAQAWLLLGLVRASLVDDDGARVAFAAALAIDGTLTVPLDSSPKVKKLFDKTKSLLPSGGGTLAPLPPPAPPVIAPPPPPAPPPPAVVTPVEHGPSLGTTIAGGALIVVGAGSAVGAFVADESLANPQAGRTRDQYDTIRGLGIAAVVGAAVLGTAGAVTLVIALNGA